MNSMQVLTTMAALLCVLSGPIQKDSMEIVLRVTIPEYAKVYIPCPTIGIFVTAEKIRAGETTDKALSRIYIKTNYNMALNFPDSIQMVHLLDIHKRRPVNVQLHYKINGVDLKEHNSGNPGFYTFPVQSPGLPDSSWLTINMSRDWQWTDGVGFYWGTIVFTFTPT